MASSSLRENSNAYQIGGIPVEFPYKPYGSQLAFMGRVISTLDRAQKQGHCHALLESPTGTGKSLSLLCSALAWQRNCKLRNLTSNEPFPSAASVASLDPLSFGGGFVPEAEPSGNSISGNLGQSLPTPRNQVGRKNVTPTIYYASRTHGQLSQVIREYRKTSYRVPMAILASRKLYCTNKNVCGKENIDDNCKKLLKDSEGCFEFKNVHKVKGHPSLKKGGCHEVHDIEDVVKVGRAVKGCSYFASRSMASEAQLVFCPYNYIMHQTIRKAMEVDINGAIVILDEAHNIEDIARDAGSLDVEEEALDTLQAELGQLCLVESEVMTYQPLYDMIQGIISWIALRKESLERREFEHYFSSWTGDKALGELREAGVTQECFMILQECAAKAIKAALDAESDGVHLSGMARATLEGLFSSLSYFFSGNGVHACDYQLSLQKYVKRDDGHSASGWTVSLNLWLLNPAVVFREIANNSLSVILTSGTLSPMGSFASELGVQFETRMEAPHVIDVESQLWASVISNGPRNCRLNASYKTADGFEFQDALGASLEEICNIVPGGALIFFPSYKLLEKLQTRWTQTGQWSRLNAKKSLFVEPRGNSENFESILRSYYDSIQGIKKIVRQGPSSSKLKDKKQFHKHMDPKELSPNCRKGEAAFLAVYRGKVSEGINFSDDNARVIVIIGIPFPNVNDIQVVLKKKYNDKYKSSKNLLSGNQWYCHQAFRALNQAAGRCIRHRSDYGAIILLDERFREEHNMTYISKWLRNSIKQYDSFDMSLEGLGKFFLNAKERFSQKGLEVGIVEMDEPDIFKKEMPSKQSVSKRTPRTRNRKRNNSDGQGEQEVGSESNIAAVKTGKLTQFLTALKNDSPVSKSKVQADAECNASIQTEEKVLDSSTENIELNCSATPRKKSWKEDILGSHTDKEVKAVSDSNITAIENRTLSRFFTPVRKSFAPVSKSSLKTNVKGETYDHAQETTDVSSYNENFDCHIKKNSRLAETVSKPSSEILSCEKQHTAIENSTITSKEESSFPTVACSEFSDQRSFSLLSTTNSPGILSERSCLLAVTPERQITSNVCSSELESSFANSINSHSQKKRVPISFQMCSHTQMDLTLSAEANLSHHLSEDANQQIGLASDVNCSKCKHRRFDLLNGETRNSLGLDMDKILRIRCLYCNNLLGLPENNFLVKCSLTSSLKTYLVSFQKSRSITTISPNSIFKDGPTMVPVLIADVATVDQRLCNGSSRGAKQPGIWCEEDGCVFRAVFCSFCANSETGLGLQVMAADASNIHLLNKILFVVDCLIIKDHEDDSREKVQLSVGSNLVQGSDSASIEKYSYLPQLKNSSSLSTTKSKLRLPKRQMAEAGN